MGDVHAPFAVPRNCWSETSDPDKSSSYRERFQSRFETSRPAGRDDNSNPTLRSLGSNVEVTLTEEAQPSKGVASFRWPPHTLGPIKGSRVTKRRSRGRPTRQRRTHLDTVRADGKFKGVVEEVPEGEYEVDAILNSRPGRTMEYWIKWKGYDNSHNTWEPLEHLTNCQLLLQQYHSQNHSEADQPRMWTGAATVTTP